MLQKTVSRLFLNTNLILSVFHHIRIDSFYACIRMSVSKERGSSDELYS